MLGHFVEETWLLRGPKISVVKLNLEKRFQPAWKTLPGEGRNKGSRNPPWEDLHKTILFVTHDVEEATFLSDRVFVMTARPGKIKAESNIPLERPRSYEMKATESFLNLKKRALGLIREEAIKATRYKE